MQRRIINPWTWQDSFGFVQGHEVTGAERTLYIAGQTSSDPDGKPVHAGDIRAQINQTLDNVETVLKQADMDFTHVARLTIYTTDMDQMMEAYGDLVARLKKSGCQQASTLLGVTRLAFPEFMVEIEVTAVA